MSGLQTIKLGKDWQIGLVPAHVKFDTIIFDPASQQVRFSYNGVTVATLTFPSMGMGDMLTINQLQGTLPITVY